LELFGVQGGEDIAEMIVRRRAIAEPAQKVQLLVPESSDVHEGFRPRQHRQKQHLVERIHHLAPLAVVRQVAEMTQKGDRLENRTTACCHIIHRRPP
jgi:hypothetical protein